MCRLGKMKELYSHILSNMTQTLNHDMKALELACGTGLLSVKIAPTFTKAGSMHGRFKIRMMELSGFKAFHKWMPEGYINFLENYGFTVTDSKIYSGGLTLTYTEARIKE